LIHGLLTGSLARPERKWDNLTTELGEL